MIKNRVYRFAKRTAVLTVITTVMLGTVACNTKKNQQSNVKQEVVETPEPCVFINEWDGTVFEVFGFESLYPPEDTFHHSIEKGRTYVNGEFSTDELDVFLKFFKNVYRVMWGELTEPLSVLEKTDDIYSFEGEYAVPQIFKRAIENGTEVNDRPERTAHLKVYYDETEDKCYLECKLIDKAEKNRKEKMKKNTKNTEGTTEENTEGNEN